MYKDNNERRDKDRERQRRYRASKGVTSTKCDKPTVTGGTCWCCGAEIDKKLVCCGPCAWSGKAKAKRAGAEPPRLPHIEADITLHPAIIAGINRLTTNPDGTVDEPARKRRMAIAYDYERKQPGRAYTGARI